MLVGCAHKTYVNCPRESGASNQAGNLSENDEKCVHVKNSVFRRKEPAFQCHKFCLAPKERKNKKTKKITALWEKGQKRKKTNKTGPKIIDFPKRFSFYFIYVVFNTKAIIHQYNYTQKVLSSSSQQFLFNIERKKKEKSKKKNSAKSSWG